MGRKPINDGDIKQKYIGLENENWIVIDILIQKDRRIYLQCKCQCGCGQLTKFRSDQFKNSKKKCDKLKNKKKEDSQKEYRNKHISRDTYKNRLFGKLYGNLKVIGFYGYNKHKQIVYKCECQCIDKNIVYATYTDLKSKRKDNCGCLTRKKQHDLKKKYNTYDLSGAYGIGYTTKGEEFWFDLEDYDKIKDYCWSIHDKYIVARDVDGKYIKMHRVVMGVTNPYIKVDHIFHHEYDNRKSELRLATNQENTFNHVLHSNNTSGVSGVSWDSEKDLWRARIFLEGKGIHLGYYDNFENAVTVRLEAEKEYFGEFQYKEALNE